MQDRRHFPSMTFPPRNKRRNRPVMDAFSMVEIIVSMGVIAIFLMMLFPMLGKMNESGKSIKCIANLRRIGQAMQRYAEDNDGYFPPHFGQSFMKPSYPSFGYVWTGHIAPYVECDPEKPVGKVFDCPNDVRIQSLPPRGYLSTGENWQLSYGYNYTPLTTVKSWPSSVNAANLRRISNLSSFIVVADSDTWNGGALIDGMSASIDAGGATRHDGGYHAVMMDGHVQWLKRSETYQVARYWRPQ